MAERCAVIGVGQTHHKAKRDDISIAGMGAGSGQDGARRCRPHLVRDRPAAVIGKAPEHVRGVDDAGAVPGPCARGGGQADDPGSHRWIGGRVHFDRGCPPHLLGDPQAGAHRRLREAVGGLRRHVGAVGAPAVRRAAAGRGRRLFRPRIVYMRCSGAPEHIGRMVAVKDRLNAIRNPYAHLHLPDIDMKTVEESMMLWDPLRYSRPVRRRMAPPPWCCPPRTRCRGHPPACIDGMAMRSEPTQFAGRDQVTPRPVGTARPTSTPRPGSPTRGRRSTSPRSTSRSAGTSRCGWRTSASPTSATGWKLTESGPPPSTATSPGTPRAGCCRPTRSGRRGCSGSWRWPCRCAARPASTRSTG